MEAYVTPEATSLVRPKITEGVPLFIIALELIVHHFPGSYSP